MTRRAIVLLILAVFTIGGLISCAGPTAEASYKIGVLVSQTGKYSALGLESLEGIDVIIDELNKNDGINGIPLELVIYDDKSSATEAVLAAKKLVEVDKVHVLIAGTITSLSMSLVPLSNEAKVPLVIMSATALFDDQIGEWCFRPMGSEDAYIFFLLDYLDKELDVTKLAALFENSVYGQCGEAYLPRRAPDYNMTIVETQYFDPAATDLTPQLTNIKNSEAQAIFIWGSGPAGSLAVKQARGMGILLPIVTTPTQGSTAMIEAFGQYYEIEPSLVVIDLKLDVWQQLSESDPDKAIYATLDQLVTQKYGHSLTMWNGIGAQLVQFVEDGLKRAQPDTANLEEARSKIRDAFESTENLSLLSATYTMSPTDHYGAGVKGHKMALVTFKEGQKVILP
jgi:branched-chain amino acid transport system substrate-binding protein